MDFKNRLFQKTLLDIDTKIIEGRGTEAKVSIIMHLKEVKVMLDTIKRVKGLSEQYENFLKDILNDLESTPSVSRGAKDVPFNKKALYRKVNPNLLAAAAAAVNIETLLNEIKNN
jgi:hypothetical protein